MFHLCPEPIDPTTWRSRIGSASDGAVVCFEGVVRNHHQGQSVTQLWYEAYEPLAVREGQRIIERARVDFPITAVLACHRIGQLQVGALAVWVGVAAAHRGPAFEACRWIIDAIKQQVPIWKREQYADQSSHWLHPLPEADSK